MDGSPAQADICHDASLRAPGDARLSALVTGARAEHAAFGAPVIDTASRLVRAGLGESEQASVPAGAMPVWRRVLRYWQSVDDDQPRTLRGPDGSPVPLAPLLAALEPPAAFDTMAASGTSPQRDALRAAVLRSAVVDNPWSAVFISHLVRAAGFAPGEFHFAIAHHTYVAQALDAAAHDGDGMPTTAAWRACDAATTAPRVGDLLCHARGAGAPGTFDAVRTALRSEPPWRRGAGLPMHCDLVVAVDRAALRADVIGGNVLQAVTLRQLALAGDGTVALASGVAARPGLGPGSVEAAAAGADAQACRGDGLCEPAAPVAPAWSVLLQSRH